MSYRVCLCTRQGRVKQLLLNLAAVAQGRLRGSDFRGVKGRLRRSGRRSPRPCFANWHLELKRFYMVSGLDVGGPIRVTRRSLSLSIGYWAFAILLGVGASLHSPALQAQTQTQIRYVAVDYARLDNPGATTVIRSMNSNNEVAGGFMTASRQASSALIFLANNGVEEVATEQGAGNSVAYGINDQGEIAGAYNTITAIRPFRAVRKVGFQELLLPTGSNGGIAYSINETGEATGYVTGSAGVRAAWWTRRGDVQLLQSVGDLASKAQHLNDRGDIVGTSGAEPRVGVVWPRKGGIVSLGTLPGFIHSEAVSISENGTIAGVASGVGDFPNRSRAVLWQSDRLAIQDLGLLPGGTDSRARDVNNRGEVVGTSNGPGGDRAFIWTAETGMQDLNLLVNVPGLVITDALSINRRGDIAVMGHDAHSQTPGESGEHVDHHAARRILVLRPLR